MKKVRLLALVMFLLSLSVHSQSIKGKLVDLVDNKPLAGATLSLTSLKDSNNVRRSLADSAGRFQFNNVTIDSFFITVSFIGYEQYKQIVSTSATMPSTDLGTMFIPKSNIEIAGVTVVSKTPPAQQKGDTLQLNASQFKVNPDATTEDLIKKMPGITVEKDGSVTAQGETVRKVTIDGREFFGDDATTALRNLPSDVVDKIQVFDRLSDQAQFTGFDDGNSQKAINIVTKSGIKNGQFGRLYGGYGTDDRYTAGGNVSFFKGDRRISFVGNFNNINQQNFAAQDLLGVTSTGNNNRGGGGNFGGGGPRGGGGGNRGGGGGFGATDNFTVGQQAGISKTNAIGVNYSDKWGKKVDVQGSYFFNQSSTQNDRIVRSQLISNGITQFTDQNTISRGDNSNHRFNLRLEYRIDSSNSLIINPSLSFQNNESSSLSSSQNYYGAGDTANTSKNESKNYRNGYNLRNNILYRHSFAKKGRTLSVNLNTTFNKNDGNGYTLSYLRYPKSASPDSLQNQNKINPTDGYNLSTNIAYTEPVGKKGQLQFNYTPSYSKNNSDQATYDYEYADKDYTFFRPDLSNKFENVVTTQNAGISYRLNFDRDNQFSIGANYQNTRLESERIYPSVGQIDQSFSNILPSLQWRKKLSAKSSLRMFYRANTNFPSVNQLQDVVDPSNPLRVTMGNPALKQSYTHFISGRYTFTNTQKGHSFFANIFMQTAQDYITNAIFVAKQDSIIQAGTAPLKAGSQLSKPVNLDGYKSLRTFFTYSIPVKLIKSTMNLNAGFSYSSLPGQINSQMTLADNYVYSLGAVFASNISQYVDFNLNYTGTINNTINSDNKSADSKYVNQSAGLQLNLLSKNGWFIQNDLNFQHNDGLAEGLNPNFWLWNAGLGKKFLKNQKGELKLSVFDLLGQNQSVQRTVTGTEIIDEQNTVLQRYFMLTFSYSLKNFGAAKAQTPQRRPMNF